MSQDITHHPKIAMADSISKSNQALIKEFINQIPEDNLAALSTSPITICQLVDGRRLACPMPLLKTKVALRTVPLHQSLYVVATDPNSQADIRAFCQHSSELELRLAQAELKSTPSDTIFHFIITKTDSN